MRSACAILSSEACPPVDSSWNVMVHSDAREGKWRGNWRMEWVASTLLTTSEHGESSITTADAHTSAASSRLNWRPRRFKWTRPFRRKMKSDFCACAITFQLASNTKATSLSQCICSLSPESTQKRDSIWLAGVTECFTITKCVQLLSEFQTRMPIFIQIAPTFLFLLPSSK